MFSLFVVIILILSFPTLVTVLDQTVVTKERSHGGFVVGFGKEHADRGTVGEIGSEIVAPHGIVFKGFCFGVVGAVVDNDLLVDRLANGAFLVGVQVAESQMAEGADFVVVAGCHGRGRLVEIRVAHQAAVVRRMVVMMLIGNMILFVSCCGEDDGASSRAAPMEFIEDAAEALLVSSSLRLTLILRI